MIKNKIICTAIACIGFTQILVADDFNSFLQKAIDQSPYLKSSSLSIKQAKEERSKLLRQENPSLGFEYSYLNPDDGKNDNSYVISYSQPVRLSNVINDKKNFGQAIINSANGQYKLDLANFIKDISIAYTKHNEQKKLLKLGEEEIDIAKKIYDISKVRHDGGSISQSVMLQSKVAYMILEAQNDSLALDTLQSYYKLLKYAGIKEEITLDTNHNFYSNKNNSIVNNPYIKSLKNLEQQSLLEATVNSNKIEQFDVYAQYQNEPDQDTASIGINIPLTLYNTKSQEKMISKLEAKKATLLIKNEMAQLNIEISRLTKEMSALRSLQKKNKLILQTEEELLTMFIQRYKIDQSNLFELQDIRNKVIQTKKRLIQIDTALNQNAINKNYLQGDYNE